MLSKDVAFSCAFPMVSFRLILSIPASFINSSVSFLKFAFNPSSHITRLYPSCFIYLSNELDISSLKLPIPALFARLFKVLYLDCTFFINSLSALKNFFELKILILPIVFAVFLPFIQSTKNLLPSEPVSIFSIDNTVKA